MLKELIQVCLNPIEIKVHVVSNEAKLISGYCLLNESVSHKLVFDIVFAPNVDKFGLMCSCIIIFAAKNRNMDSFVILALLDVITK
jgi:hypothetical protein